MTRQLSFLVVLLAIVGVAFPGLARASIGGQAENGIWGIDLVMPVLVTAAAPSRAEHHPGNDRLGFDLPSRATLAAGELGAAEQQARGAAEAAGIELNPGDPEIGRIIDLGTDPAIGGKFRVAEAETALRVESETGTTLSRAPEGAPYDWTDQAGNTYDAVGNFDGQYFDEQWPQLQGRIADHLAKADFVPVDVAGFTPAQVAKVEAYIQQFGGRVFIVGR